MNSTRPSLLRRIVALPAALLLPPLGVFLARGVQTQLYVCFTLIALSVLVFFTLYAGVGVLLYLLAIAHAALVALLALARRIE